MSSESDPSLSSSQGLEKSSSKYILSQSKKPSGTTKSKDGEDTGNTNELENDDDGNDNEQTNLENKGALELRVQVKEMRMELERRESELKDLQVLNIGHIVVVS